MLSQVLLHSSAHFKERVEKVDMERRDFLDLLDVFVGSNW